MGKKRIESYADVEIGKIIYEYGYQNLETITLVVSKTKEASYELVLFSKDKKMIGQIYDYSSNSYSGFNRDIVYYKME